MQNKKAIPVFSALFFISGMSALLYQVVWTKKLSLLFGVTTYAVSTTLSVFMLGLALGSWYFGAAADRTARPLKTYVWLEAGIALSAAVSLALLEAMDSVIGNLGFSSSWSPGFTICRLVGSFAVLIVPTFLMGGTAPVLAKVVVTSSQTAGRKLGLLYAANTMGGVAGCLLAGFVAIPVAGLRATVWIGVLGNLAVALIARMLVSREDASEVNIDSAAPAIPNTEVLAPSLNQPPRLVRAMLAAFFITGFLGLAVEVVWTRLLLLYLESSAQTFAAMLAVYLAGLALGSALCGRFADRYNPAAGFALLQCLTGAIILGSLVFWLPHWEAATQAFSRWAGSNVGLIHDHNSAQKFLYSLVHSGTLLFLPTFLMGCAFPFAVRFFSGEIGTLGKTLGTAYMLNTLGCMLGPLVCGFWGLPYVGVQNSLIFCGLGYLICGAVLAAIRTPVKLHWFAAGVVGLAALATGLMALPDRALLTVTQSKTTTMVYHEEDHTGSVFVLDLRLGNETIRQLLVGSTSMISNNFRCQRYTHLIGDLPMLMHPAPRKALVICLGSGMTLSAVASHPGIESIDCADLSEGVINSARQFFAAENAHVLEDPRVHVIVNDGRTHLLATPERYDVIALEPPPPNNAGVSNLYSREFYQLCKSRLKKGGMIAQWVPYHCMTLAQSQSVVGTMQSVFPTTTFWEFVAGREYCVIGHEDDAPIPYERIAARLAAPAVNAQLSAVGIRNAEDLLACFLMGPAQVGKFTAQAPLITDDLPGLGYDMSAYAYVSMNNQAVNTQIQSAMLETTSYSEDPAGFFSFADKEAKAAFVRREAPVKKAWLMNSRATALTITDELKTEIVLGLGRDFEAPTLLDPYNLYYQNVQKYGVYTKTMRRLASYFQQTGETTQSRQLAVQLDLLETHPK